MSGRRERWSGWMERRLLVAFTLLVGVAVFDTAGYMAIGGWALLEAFY